MSDGRFAQGVVQEEGQSVYGEVSTGQVLGYILPVGRQVNLDSSGRVAVCAPLLRQHHPGGGVGLVQGDKCAARCLRQLPPRDTASPLTAKSMSTGCLPRSASLIDPPVRYAVTECPAKNSARARSKGKVSGETGEPVIFTGLRGFKSPRSGVRPLAAPASRACPSSQGGRCRACR